MFKLKHRYSCRCYSLFGKARSLSLMIAKSHHIGAHHRTGRVIQHCVDGGLAAQRIDHDRGCGLTVIQLIAVGVGILEEVVARGSLLKVPCSRILRVLRRGQIVHVGTIRH